MLRASPSLPLPPPLPPSLPPSLSGTVAPPGLAVRLRVPPAMLRALLVLLSLQSVAAAPTARWLCYTQGVQTSPAMVSASAPIAITFADGLSPAGSTAQWEVTLRARNGTVLSTKIGSGAGETTLPALGCPSCLATWEARFSGGPTSPKQVVFTPAAGWADGSPAPVGMWAPDNATKNGPQFVLLKADVPPSATRDSVYLTNTYSLVTHFLIQVQ